MKNLDTTLRDLQELQSTFAKVTETAVALGAKPYGLNEKNALLTVLKAAEGYAETEATVKELGYTSLAVALKALGQTNRPLVELPAALRHAPPHWVHKSYYEVEWYEKNFRTHSRQRLVRGTNARTAQRQRAGLEKDLQELWHLVLTDDSQTQEQKDDYLKELVDCYNKLSYFEFSQCLLRQLNDFNGNGPTDDEVEDDEEETVPELDAHTREKLERLKQQCVENGSEYDEQAALSLLQTT